MLGKVLIYIGRGGVMGTSYPLSPIEREREEGGGFGLSCGYIKIFGPEILVVLIL